MPYLIRNLRAWLLLATGLIALPASADHTGPPRRLMMADDSVKRLAIVARDGALHDAPLPPNGNMLTQLGWQRIVEVAPDKQIVWEYEGPLFGKERKGGHGREAFGNAVFSAIRLTNGNTLITTGNGHTVLEATPKKEIAWKVEQHDLPGITLARATRLERLPHGNTLIGNCHAGPDNPRFIEITPGKQVVWTFRAFKDFGDSTPIQIVLGNP
jgi:hypothetical protein